MQTTSNRFQLRSELASLTYLGICGQEHGDLRIQYALITHHCVVADYEDYLEAYDRELRGQGFCIFTGKDHSICRCPDCDPSAGLDDAEEEPYTFPGSSLLEDEAFGRALLDEIDPLPEANESPRWSVRSQLRSWFWHRW